MSASMFCRAFVPAVALAAALPAHANPGSTSQAGTVAASAVPADPLAWLQRAAAAARTTSYSGTVIHMNGERTTSMRVTHVVVGGEEHERIEPLDGPPQEIVRRNEEMFCYFPETKTVRLDRRVTARFFPAIFRAPPEAIAQSYNLELGKVERVANHECQWIRLEPRDAMRFAQRLCAEISTGLLVRAKTFNDRKQVLEQFTFTDLRLGPHVARSEVKSAFSGRAQSWRTDPRPREEAKGADTGWLVANPPPGYRLVSEMRRTLPGRTQPVSQIVLSDGLASMSVFVEPAATPPRVEGTSEDGTTGVYVRPAGDVTITVLGEVPVAALKQVGGGVQRRP